MPHPDSMDQAAPSVPPGVRGRSPIAPWINSRRNISMPDRYRDLIDICLYTHLNAGLFPKISDERRLDGDRWRWFELRTHPAALEILWRCREPAMMIH